MLVCYLQISQLQFFLLFLFSLTELAKPLCIIHVPISFSWISLSFYWWKLFTFFAASIIIHLFLSLFCIDTLYFNFKIGWCMRYRYLCGDKMKPTLPSNGYTQSCEIISPFSCKLYTFNSFEIWCACGCHLICNTGKFPTTNNSMVHINVLLRSRGNCRIKKHKLFSRNQFR